MRHLPTIISDEAILTRDEIKMIVASAMISCAKATELAIAQGRPPKAEDIIGFAAPILGFIGRGVDAPNAREAIGGVVDLLSIWRQAA